MHLILRLKLDRGEIVRSLVKLGGKLLDIEPHNPIILKTEIHNPWFTARWTSQSIMFWANTLTYDNLNLFIENYPVNNRSKKIGLIMAGNIPLVGIHDLICILLSGHTAYIKTSSDDTILTEWFIKNLIKIDGRFSEKIQFVDRLNDCESLIATGSNNSARYFDYYFKHIPKIIRKNRNSLAVLTGNETKNELELLADDIFSYFGLGCRNVSKIMVPAKYNFNLLFEAFEKVAEIQHHHKYYNNYTYHKAIFLMDLVPHMDNGFVIVKEDKALASPLGCLFFSYYDGLNDISEYLKNNIDNIQITVGNNDIIKDCVAFGQSQYPKLMEYADKVDTTDFLLNL